jgi:outer membrane protein OmpA-like peptidoglycan-associated protein/opacity protein-like surface antigen
MNRRMAVHACLMLVGVVIASTSFGQGNLRERGTEHPWSISICGGLKDHEGDEAIADIGFASVALTYDYSRRMTFEGVLTVMPSIPGNDQDYYSMGVLVATSNRLMNAAGVDNTSAIGISLECLYHLTRWERIDPYLVAGAGAMFYADDIGDGTVDTTFSVGAGVLYHFNDEWALRADARGFLSGLSSVQANSLINVGAVWTIGAHVPADPRIGDGEIDSDADGLSDLDEIGKYGTDPQNPDTDGDDLSDYDEVMVYKTNPLEKDTDLDMLTDGEEVLAYKTNPLLADTDNGGVSDGHEVLEDSTNPLDPSDDLLLFSLKIEFDTNKSDIKPLYFPDLDKIGKVLARYPGSTAKIEGHADQRKRSVAAYNVRLSERRAQAVLAYLNKNWQVDASRMAAKGYGFSRPVAPNDPVTGNPENRRVDIYIDGANDAKAAAIDVDEPRVREKAADENVPITIDNSLEDDLPEKGAVL